MSNQLLIIAHAPLASALRECALHVYPDCAERVAAVDVPPQELPDDTLVRCRKMAQEFGQNGLLVMTDIYGATPSNIAQKLVNATDHKLVVGVNLPMLIRTVCYLDESLDNLVQRALSGGVKGVMQLASSAPLYQVDKTNDSNQYNHQQ
ncbi:MAG: PTS fructose transporter subunit IIA [Betaproteobacteria bacterium]|jgi:PTS system mannose-specific IIA component